MANDIRSPWVGVVGVLVLCAVLVTVVRAQANGFVFVNGSTVAIREIQLAVPGTAQWGPNVLRLDALAPGRRVRVSPPSGCVADVRVEYTDDREEYYRRTNLCASTELTLDGSRAQPRAAWSGPARDAATPMREPPTTRGRCVANCGPHGALAAPPSAESRSIRSAPPEAPRTLPEFPWPPPEPSARAELARALFATSGAPDPSLAIVGTQLVGALEQAKYSEYSFYRAPGGFALVARLERMADDGTPLPEELRFLHPGTDEPFSLTVYVRRLFFAPPGLYRQIVFVVSDQPFTATGTKLDARGAAALLSGGANRLSRDFETMPFTARHGVSALVYEFKKGVREGDVVTLTPGRLPARAHLERAGIAPALGQGR